MPSDLIIWKVSQSALKITPKENAKLMAPHTKCHHSLLYNRI